PRRHRARRECPGPHRVPRHAARLACDAAASGLSSARRLHSAAGRSCRRRRAAPRPGRPRAGARRRHFSRRALQRARPARARAARRRSAGAPLRRAGGAGGDPGHVGSAARPPLLYPASDTDHRALRSSSTVFVQRRLGARRPARRDRAHHGRHRRPAAVSKTWGGRFSQGTDAAAERFTASLAFDRRLWPQDVAGSIAWTRALARARVLTDAERDAIVKGLEAVRGELEAGTFPFRPELEDIHTNIERRLVELIGEVGGKLHTGRSRNDQIALDERMYLKDAVARARDGLRAVQAALVARAGETSAAPMPGYTHLQRAQPIVLAHHLLAYVFMLERDRERLAGCAARADRLPLGAAALAGTAFPIDREALARELGFGGVTSNSLDAVDTLEAVLGVLPPLLASLTFRTERMRAAAGEHYATATDLADYLVRKGLPFRQAHEIVGKIVRLALERGVALEALPLDAL